MAELIASRLLEMLSRDVISIKSSEKILRHELNLLNTSIDDAAPKSSIGQSEWVKRMREVSELIEDTVDEGCAFPKESLGFINYLSRTGLGLTAGRRDSPSKINSTKALLRDMEKIPKNIEDLRYGDRITLPSDELFLEGIRPLVCVLLRNYLVGQDPAYLDLAVFVVGLGGVGESTLNEVYNDEVVQMHFDICVWIVPPHPDPEVPKFQIVESVVWQICQGNYRARNDLQDAMIFPEMVNILRRFLKSKRYLLVFKDVWDVEIWDAIKIALPDYSNGSRIFITTRRRNVASACKLALPTGAHHRPQPLSEEMVQALFVEIASDHVLERPNVSDLLNNIAHTCKKYPLAIVAVAGLLLSPNKFPRERRNLVQNFSFEVEPSVNLECLSEILALGFFTLSHQLKSCFLYFSLLPKESLIPNAELFKLWIAEGFVEERTGQSLEEVAQEYLNELISRNLVQVRKGFYGIEHFSRAHCLMHGILQKEAGERSFCQIWGLNEKSSSTVKSRRILINNHSVDDVLASIAAFRVRTIFLSNVDGLSHSFLVGLFEKYKLLTLLDIENSPLEYLPNEIGDLTCLKYLSLRNTRIRTLPKSVSKLQKLQTLDLTRTLLFELPMEIFLLRNIRHLLASRCDNKISLDPAKGVTVKPGIGYLVNLLTLTVVEAHLSGMAVIRELKKLKKLRSLSVSRLTTKLSSALCVCIYMMSNLKALRLHSMNNESLDLQKISIPPPNLEHLVLKGLVQKLPNWISRLQNLKVLCLSLSKLADDPLRRFSLLPYLESLWLYRAYEGQRLHFQGSGFQSLKLLVLRDLQGLEAIEIEEGSLPLLEELRIGPSPLLNKVPSGVTYLRNLKVISFYDMPREFLLRLKPDEGWEYWKVEHIRSVFIFFRDEGRRYLSYKLRDDDDLWRRLEDMDVDSNNIGQRDSRLSFSYSDDEEDAATISNLQWNDMPQVSFSSDRFTFFTDDVEE